MLLIGSDASFSLRACTQVQATDVGGCLLLGLGAGSSFRRPIVSGLAMPAATITGYLIPGYLLRRTGSHDTV